MSPVVAVVGRPNVGKSSLLNALTGAGVLVENALFATLEPTTRRGHFDDGRPFVLTDTVGFVRHLPTQLVEAFRSTRATLSLYSVGNDKPSVISVTSANGGEGKTTVVANLALAMATSGKRVLAISADLRKPSLHAYFPQASRAGLLDVLSGNRDLLEATGWVSLNGSSVTGGRLGLLATNGRFRDPARLFEERQRFDPAGHYHRPDVLRLNVTAPD